MSQPQSNIPSLLSISYYNVAHSLLSFEGSPLNFAVMKSTATIETTTVVDSAESEGKSEAQEAAIFDKTTEKGEEEGLFRACMKSIRNAHKSANRLRSVLVVSGLFTDVKVYREVIVLFYAATNAMETRMLALKDEEGDEICDKLLSLGYRFAPQYEKDIKTLYNLDDDGNNTNADLKLTVEKVLLKSTDGAKAYIETIENMSSGTELAGAAFCLWGALIIGGGAMAMPRVQSLCGKDACHLFRDVTGPGRSERKTKFIQMFDSLTKDEKNNDEKKDTNNDDGKSFKFDRIVTTCQECMKGNNELMTSVKINPWWLKYIVSTAVATVSVVAFYYLPKSQRERT